MAIPSELAGPPVEWAGLPVSPTLPYLRVSKVCLMPPGTWYIAILHGPWRVGVTDRLVSRRQCCGSIHSGWVLVCRAAPWTVIKNMYVVLQRCWYRRNYYKQRRTRRRSGRKPGLREANPGAFATICKKLTVKQYTKDIKNYIRMPE